MLSGELDSCIYQGGTRLRATPVVSWLVIVQYLTKTPETSLERLLPLPLPPPLSFPPAVRSSFLSILASSDPCREVVPVLVVLVLEISGRRSLVEEVVLALSDEVPPILD